MHATHAPTATSKCVAATRWTSACTFLFGQWFGRVKNSVSVWTCGGVILKEPTMRMWEMQEMQVRTQWTWLCLSLWTYTSADYWEYPCLGHPDTWNLNIMSMSCRSESKHDGPFHVLSRFTHRGFYRWKWIPRRLWRHISQPFVPGEEIKPRTGLNHCLQSDKCFICIHLSSSKSYQLLNTDCPLSTVGWQEDALFINNLVDSLSMVQ